MNIPVHQCTLSGILEHPVPEIRAGVSGTECTAIKLKSNHTFGLFGQFCIFGSSRCF